MKSCTKKLFPALRSAISPILPPRRYGQSKSMDFMPVSTIYCLSTGDEQFYGIYRWIEYFLYVFIGPFSSIGSPTTFITLPRVSVPTGMQIGDPVSLTSCPR